MSRRGSLTKTLNGVTDTYTNDDADKLTQVVRGGTAIKTFGYDAAGRTTSVVTGSGTTTLTYDYESRVTGITYPNSSTNSFAYNGLDTRTSKTDSAGTFTYKRDGAYVTDPVLSDSAASFTPGISERRSSTSKFYGSDYLGTNSLITDSSQATTDTRQYDAFGMLVGSTGSTPTPFGFAGGWGYQEDGDSGLKLLGHRYYDVSTGRFITRDPAMFHRNWYTYASNSPNSLIDADGLQSKRGKILILLMKLDAPELSGQAQPPAWYDDAQDIVGAMPGEVGITTKRARSRKQFIDAMSDPELVLVIILGHGDEGHGLKTDDGYVVGSDYDEIARRRKGRRIDFVAVRSCFVLKDPSTRGKYRAIADHGYGHNDFMYPGTYDSRRRGNDTYWW